MQRRSTKNTRAANADEKRFHQWIKMQPSCAGGHGITEAHHCKGATYRHNKVLVGHWFVIPLSQSAHQEYHKGTKAFKAKHGPQSHLWHQVYCRYVMDTGNFAPREVVEAIMSSRQ